MRRFSLTFLVPLALAIFIGRTAPLEAQCPPPAGTYTMTIQDPLFPACPGTPVSFDVVGSSTGAVITGFGFNITITGGGVTAVSVSPGFVPPMSGGFLSAVSAAGTEIAAQGADPGGIGLSTLATITFTPTTVSPLTISFGGTLALSTGMAPIDHLVVGGCDVWAGSSPALAVVGGMTFCPTFIRGDCNNNGLVIGFVGDIVFFFEWMFSGGPAPACENACDANDDELLDITDGIYLVNWQFGMGPPPPPPTPMFVPTSMAPAFLDDCGNDLTPGMLSCASVICP